MLLLFFRNTTASLVETLIKLIIVTIVSALIICFCHRLTNYKKSRRCKTINSASNNNNQDILAANNNLNGRIYIQHYHDPYNSANHLNRQTFLDENPLNNSAQLASLQYGYPHQQPNFFVSPIEHQQQQLASSNALLGPAITNLIANPAYSNPTAPSYNQPPSSELFEHLEACPTYEEAIASSQHQQLQHQEALETELSHDQAEADQGRPPNPDESQQAVKTDANTA